MISSGRPIRPWPCVRIGERVRICTGPLEGLEEFWLERSPELRVVVNMDLLNRAVAVEVDSDMVRGVSADAAARG